VYFAGFPHSTSHAKMTDESINESNKTCWFVFRTFGATLKKKDKIAIILN
jgi:hypothetical protein